MVSVVLCLVATSTSCISRRGNPSGRSIVVFVIGVSQEVTSKVFITLYRSFLSGSALATVHGCGIAVRVRVSWRAQLLTIPFSTSRCK